MTDDGMPDAPGNRRQVEVYMQGMADVTPDVPVSYEKLEAEALDALSPEAYDYVAGGAGEERTVSSNRRAFDKWRIVPRMLRGAADRDLTVELFGREYAYPLFLAPLGVQSIIHDEGELATARAAASLDFPFVLSSASSETLEDVADAADEASSSTSGADDEDGNEDAESHAPKWFQLYPSADRDISASFLERAEETGYEAIVVTVDTPMLGWRERDIERAYLPFLDGEGVANYFSDPAFRARLDDTPEDRPLLAIREFIDVFGDATLSWDDLDWLREQTDLPLLVKGILHPEDARQAVAHGADGLVVSNHGGRQIDAAIPALDALPGIIDAVGDKATILFDSGIRTGSDALVALALGAEAVLIGRPYAYGLALDGQQGVEAVCANVLADLDLTLGLCGYSAIGNVERSLLTRS
ncbi:alpha-hydroxy-acid oxidizing enzyme [Haloprofundus marisrubri]|uniref:Alpha-hydroxy-acid oxidizing enzyme n=1 Tax=Haloprofundus marisrubri TaxID=1514971 RepID=A0A0W1R3E0_9EURY|nr:lactate 2-monooxygenase [Haloprofundus marisrubri]KTG07865.1 alpha-hydroxy-acid oxidizing enzyme [Haloprofundus marisrubri]